MSNWDYQKALQLKVGDQLLWKHRKYKEYKKRYKEKDLLRTISIKSIHNGFIKTTYGTYDLMTGRNSFEACGCKRFCDCYGHLELIK